MAKLTSKSCESAKPIPGRDLLLGDGDGLSLRIRPNGNKTWMVEYEFKGRRRKPTIGVYDRDGSAGESITAWLEHGRLSLAQARSVAAAWRAHRRAGHDPAAEWEAHLAAKEAAAEAARLTAKVESEQPTVRGAFDSFLAKHIAGKKCESAIGYRLNRLAQLLGEKKIRDVTRKDIIGALEKIGEGQKEGRTAKQLAGEVLIQAKRVWRYAETREWVAVSCIERLGRRDFDAKPRKRDVTLGLDEVVTLWKALEDRVRCKADATTVAALRLLILTGQREREVTDAEWNEFDLSTGLWKIPAKRTKSGRAHLVHLSDLAIRTLAQLKDPNGACRYVFESPLRPGQPIYGRSVNNALGMMFKRGALPNVTACHVHDLRRTLITRLPDLGFEPFIGHKIANHVLPGVLAHYNHNEYLTKRREALEAWANRIDTLATNSKIVQLHRPAA